MRNLLSVSTAIALALAASFSAGAPNLARAQQKPSAESGKAALPGGIRLVEKVERTGDEIIIPYEKYVLPNGLTVILHEDKSDPLVHVDVTYEVGSGREEIGRSGFAHFFEHMMFQGSENVGDEEHFKIVSESGGTLNGTTNSDRTNYFETAPSNQLEKMLWLEADRMGFLLDAVTQEKFEVQRETVKNERGQRVDNAPYGLLGERVGEAMYPEGHPYSWSTIGYIEDLNRADLDDLKRFFLRWYGPNNAVLTIGGDLDKAKTLEWIAKYFGPIPTGPAVEDPKVLPVSLDKDRYISLEDNVALPLVFMSWPTVHARHPDEAPLDVLSSILGQGRNSLLYKNLIKEGFAVQANSGHGCRELHCSLTMLSLPNPQRGKTLADLEATMRASLAEFETRGVQDDDLLREKGQLVSNLIFGLESVSGKVSQLAAFQTFANDANYIGKEIARYEAVTKEDVVRVYNQYIKDKPAVIMSIVPKGQAAAVAKPDTWTRTERTIPPKAAEKPPEFRRATDNFDRSVQPGANGGNPTLTPPATWNSTLANGVRVLGAVNNETPTTAISIRLKVGQRNETMDKLGVASLTAAMLNETTQKSSNEDIANRLAKLGSSVTDGAGNTYTTITIRSLTKNLDETLAIAAERLFEPAFAPADFSRLKAQTLQGIRQAKTQPPATASLVYDRLIYGRDNPAAHRDEGLTETVQTLTVDDVKAFYETNFSAAIASIVVVSDAPQADVTAKLARFGDWAAKPVPVAVEYATPEINGTTIYFVNRDNAAQSEIRIGMPGLKYDATGEFYRAGLMNFALGGAFNSRINLNLREEKGYSYGARAFFFGDEFEGEFTASAGVRTDSTQDSIVQFLKEIDGFRTGGVREDELAFTKAAIGQSDARRYETPIQKLAFLGNMQTYNLQTSYVAQQNDILKGLTKAEVDQLAAKLLPSDDKVIVVVGDRKMVMEGLQSFGHPIVELNEDGEPLAK